MSLKSQVKFAEERNTVHEFIAVDRTDHGLVASLWQQPWEMAQTKQSLKVRAKQWRTTGLGILLANTFVGDNGLEENQKLCQRQLNTFAQLPDDLYNRGIERHLNRKHDQERTSRKTSNVRLILARWKNIQEQCLIHNKNEEHNTAGVATLEYATNDPLVSERLFREQAEHVAKYAQSLNRHAALFARRLGKADEVVMRKGPAESVEAAYVVVDHLMELERRRLASSQLSPAVMSTHESSPPAATSLPPRRRPWPSGGRKKKPEQIHLSSSAVKSQTPRIPLQARQA